MSDSIYSRPVAPRIVLRPLLVTVALHALLLYVLTMNWSSADQQRRVKPVPRVINARLVDIAELQPKKQEKPVSKPRARPKPVAKARPKPRPVAKPKPKPKPVQKTTPKAQAKPKPKAEPKPQPQAESEPRMTEAELAAIAQADIARAMEAEDQVQAEYTAEQMTASYAALIQRTVMNYWSRPPSARNGMEALLSVQLIPSGEVISVSVVRSSGSVAFDRSAINAVQKAGSFPELQRLPSRDFEKSFRRFSLLFRPEDLRY